MDLVLGNFLNSFWHCNLYSKTKQKHNHFTTVGTLPAITSLFVFQMSPFQLLVGIPYLIEFLFSSLKNTITLLRTPSESGYYECMGFLSAFAQYPPLV